MPIATETSAKNGIIKDAINVCSDIDFDMLEPGINEEIATPNQYPYSAVGLVRSINAQGKVVIGTGSIVGPNVVLTSANNLYDL